MSSASLRFAGHRGVRATVSVLLAVAFAAPLLAADPAPAPVPASPAVDPATLEIQRLLRSFREVGSVLYVAAHPDDENTEFISYFARGRAFRTAYLSVTRGDGGQNELGADFGDKLGVLRTQELLAARRLDGGRQFFTRAIDFGFSKTPEETLRFWDHDRVLADVVRVIRRFQPDVIVTRFPIPPGSGGHGHHTASAMLAVEAFKLAGDPKAFPDQLAEGLTPWQAKRILWNVFSWNRGPGPLPLPGTPVSLDLGGHDPLTDEPFGTLANRSRGMHKTQGLGGLAARTASGPNVQQFLLLAGEPAAQDLFDGVDLTWARVPGGAGLGPLAADLAAKFDPQNPAASVPAILAIRAKLLALADAATHESKAPSALLADKLAQIDRLLVACLGLEIESTTAHSEVVPGEEIRLRDTVVVRADFPMRWTGTRHPAAGHESGGASVALQPGVTAFHESTLTIPADAPLTQPYWLREAPTAGLYTVDDPALIGRPENPPAFPVEEQFEIAGQPLVVTASAVSVTREADARETRRPVAIVAPVSIAWSHPVALFAPGSTHAVTLDLTAVSPGVRGTVELAPAPGWQVAPASRDFALGAVGERTSFTFEITAPRDPATARLAVRAKVDGRSFATGRIDLRYDHLPAQLLQPVADLTAVALDVAVRAKKIGYLPGAGDDVAASLRLLGCEVTSLDSPADLAPDALRGYDAIVLGVRAFNENKNLAAAFPALLAYVEAGGTVVAQYNRPSNDLKTRALGPYALSIDGPAPQLRVTDETAPVTFLAPEHPALNTPNKILSADFAGWVQERGAYFPSSWDETHYTALLAMSDPGEPPLKSSLLVAKHGSGYFVYTGLSFFRQLPAGNPGAYRLLANLVSLGK